MGVISNKFLEIHEISILNGSIVIAHAGKYETLTINNKIPDTLDLIELITENYETIYLADINGLLQGKPQLELIHKIVEFCEVWLDAGVSESEQVYDLFVAGVQDVVLSSKTISGLLELARAYELSENLIFEFDYDHGLITSSSQLRKMQITDLAKEIKDIGINRLIFADISRIDKNKSIEREIIRKLTIPGVRLYVGGGIKLKDTSTLRSLGTAGAIVELVDVLKYGKVEF